MRQDEEIIDACIALGLFLLLCVFYCCVTYFDKVESFCQSFFPCHACCRYCCCSNCCQGSNDLDDIPQYNSLEEFLWDATEDSPMGRIVTANNVQEIEGDEDKYETPLDLSQCFLPVLRQKFQTNRRRSRQPEDNTLLAEPLL